MLMLMLMVNGVAPISPADELDVTPLGETFSCRAGGLVTQAAWDDMLAGKG